MNQCIWPMDRAHARDRFGAIVSTSSFLGPSAERLLADPSLSSLRRVERGSLTHAFAPMPERELATMLFADIVASTALTKCLDAEETHRRRHGETRRGVTASSRRRESSTT